MENIRAVFIDVDNTLLDFDEYVKTSLRGGFKKFNIAEYEPWMYDVFEVENSKLWRALERKELTFEELKAIRFTKVFKALGFDFDGPSFEEFFRSAIHESAIEVPGAMDLLKRLSEKYIVCAASNGPYEQQCHRLEKAGMTQYMQHCFVSENLGANKPSEKFFDAAFERLNKDLETPIKPEECIMIGDSMSADMAGGIKYGMKTCYYDRLGAYMPSGSGDPDMVVTSLADIDI